MQAYCVKCRAKREIKNSRAVTKKHSNFAVLGD
ncbi:MAG: DUF5679 domain-containing protein [Dehalococcoidia bacterium]|nr:DUF5679 domain-containing protein [Dehalococcoidia bacterium]